MTDQSVNEPAAPVKAGDADTAVAEETADLNSDTAVAEETADQGTPSFMEKLGEAVRSIKQRFGGGVK